MDALILRASPNSLSAVRSLGRAGLVVAIAAPPLEDLAVCRSRYVSRYVRLEDLDDRSVDTLLALPDQPGHKPFLLATGDQDALLVARNQVRLAERYCFVSPAYQALENIVDKGSLYATAKRHGIPHPKFHVVRELADIEDAVEAVGTPCYVKPAMSHEWRRVRRTKLERVVDEAELRRVLLECVSLRLAAIATEIIPGDDGQVHSVCAYIDSRGQPVDWRTKRKIRQYPVDAGDGCAQEITDEPAVAELGLRLLTICGHRGPATVEFRRDPRDGRYVLMEINARTILGQEMIARSGLDAPLLAWHDATGRPFPATRPMHRTRWISMGLDFRAFRELRRRGSITTCQWLKSIAGCRSFAFFAWDDPVPFLLRIARWLEHQVRRKIRHPARKNC